MSPEHIEAFTIAASFVTTIVGAGCVGYLGYRFLKACDHIEKIYHDAEHTRYDVKSIERHLCREACGEVCKHE